MVVGVGGQNFIHFRGLWFTSFYLPGRLFRQFNISQSIPLPLKNFTEENRFVTPSVSLSIERMWRGRLTRQFEHTRFGLSKPLRVSVITSIWQSMGADLMENPYQMCWFQFMGTEPTDVNVVRAYQILEEDRIAQAAEDPIWPPPRT